MEINQLEFNKVVPKDRLELVVETENIECDKRSTRSMFEALSQQKPRDTESIFREYKYAGKTAVNIFEVVDFPERLNNKTNFLAHMKRKLRIRTQVTGRNFMPEMSEIPQVNFIDDLGEAIVIQWVSGELKLFYDGYRQVERMPPSFNYMMIRFGSPVFVELRAGFSARNKFLEAFNRLLSLDPSETFDVTWLPVTKVTEAEAEAIATRLRAGLTESEVIGDGCIGKFSVYAAPDVVDLKQQQQYLELVQGRSYLAQVFYVDYDESDTGYSTKVKFRINLKGGFEFKSKVSERIIRRILDVFIEVRYGSGTSSDEEIQEPAS